MKLGPLNARCVRSDSQIGPPVLLVHGIGLGAWLWERDQQLLAEAGLTSWAIDLPGHDGSSAASMEDCYQAVAAAAAELGVPAIVGHSAGGLVAQVVAHRQDVASLVLTGAVPPAPINVLPTWAGVRSFLPQLGRLAARRPLRLGLRDYVRTGLPAGVDVSRLRPWPNQMVRDMAVRRPRIPRLDCPVLVTHGLLDQVAPLRGARLLADHHHAPLWRFDDLAHHPMLEPDGERHARAVAEWLLSPHGRRVPEIDPLRPDEGVGARARSARRGLNAPRSGSRFGDRRRKG